VAQLSGDGEVVEPASEPVAVVDELNDGVIVSQQASPEMKIAQPSTYLIEQSLVEAVVIPKEIISAGHTRVALEHSVGVQTPNDRWGSGVLASLASLAADAEEIGDEVPVDEVRGVGDETGGPTLHVEAFLDGLDDLGWGGDSVSGKVLGEEGRSVSLRREARQSGDRNAKESSLPRNEDHR
jgi:hypothetical protein